MRYKELESRILAALFMSAGAFAIFLKIVDEIFFEGEKVLDQGILLAFRNHDDPTQTWGPQWLADFASDITALGSFGVLTLVTIATTVFLLVARKLRTAGHVAFAVLGGTVMVNFLKILFDRARPEITEAATNLYTMSFPSGHATLAAVTYLTIAAVVTRDLHQLYEKVYVIALAAILSISIGISRIYLGVHWPSDVMAGWALGAAWALLCWAFSEHLRIRSWSFKLYWKRRE